MTTEKMIERLGDRLEELKRKGLLREDILERFKAKKEGAAQAVRPTGQLVA